MKSGVDLQVMSLKINFPNRVTTGNRVAQLVDRNRQPGVYTVPLDMSRFSGMYLYTLNYDSKSLSGNVVTVR